MNKTEKKSAVDVEQRIEGLLKQLNLREKVSLLAGQDVWHTVPIERLGIPSIVMSDGPHGLRSSQPEAGRMAGPCTSFPTGASMASSWDPELVKRVGAAIAEETRAMGCDIILGPCVNIVRTPLAGRNFESYSEDPYLAGTIGAAYVKGVQSKGVGTSLKHFACNNQEIERGRGSSQVDERTFREIYLAQFEKIVKEANPWTVMCSYNRINGVYASQNYYLLNEILKKEWGFEGVVVSDWGANHTIFESVKGGLDLEMPGPAKYYGRLLLEAVHNWQIDESTIDEAVRRILRMVIKSGKMDGPAAVPAGSRNTPEHQSLARELAEASITLLKNDSGLLPVDLGKVRSIAVIGPSAADMKVSGGGSSRLEPPYQVNPLEALQGKLAGKVSINYAKGCDNFVEIPALKASGSGFHCTFFNNTQFSGKPSSDALNKQLEFWWGQSPDERVSLPFSARWEGQISVEETGLHRIELTTNAKAVLYVDGKPVLESSGSETRRGDYRQSTVSIEIPLSTRKSHSIKLELVRQAALPYSFIKVGIALSIKPEEDNRIQKAARLAGKSDLALVFVGMPESYESEGSDRPNMDLPGRQDELVHAVAKANKNTVVILNCGAPVRMPWVDEVAAVVDMSYPGLEGGNAVANVLVGEVNPSGKLSVTFPVRLEDNPSFGNYPGWKEVNYGEGLFVGYRHYDAKDIQPLFPFGHGLSYTTFEYTNLHVDVGPEIKTGQPVEVSLEVKNTGPCPGKEVVQLYVHDIASSLPRPIQELKGFTKVNLQPGESTHVRFSLSARDLSFYDPYKKAWIAEPGEFELRVGSSSRDIRLKASFTLL